MKNIKIGDNVYFKQYSNITIEVTNIIDSNIEMQLYYEGEFKDTICKFLGVCNWKHDKSNKKIIFIENINNFNLSNGNFHTNRINAIKSKISYDINFVHKMLNFENQILSFINIEDFHSLLHKLYYFRLLNIPFSKFQYLLSKIKDQQMSLYKILFDLENASAKDIYKHYNSGIQFKGNLDYLCRKLEKLVE